MNEKVLVLSFKHLRTVLDQLKAYLTFEQVDLDVEALGK